MNRRVKHRAVEMAMMLLLAAFPCDGEAACSVTATPVSFGTYNPASATPLDVAGNVQLVCSGVLGLLINYSIALSTGSSGSYAARTMLSGGNSLSYNLYTDTARTVTWGDGTGGTSTVNGSITIIVLGSVTRNYSVYGRIPALQNVPAGSYADTITVTVNY